ncbi:MAG TPA: ABC transporter ATP-binding protein [Ilumatobacter sp.]|nr:ABC transporter ATP-binding protein [Ilumatobacter sp.]
MAGVGKAHLRTGDDVLVRVEDLVVEFPAGKRGKVQAVSEVSFDIRDGETLGVVGESGCGKSTTGRAILQLPPPTSGTVEFDGIKLTELSGEEMRKVRPNLQMIFQDPISSLNERRTVRDIVGEGLRVWGTPKDQIGERVDEVLQAVGLDPQRVGDRLPRSFSGGQCQRICIARALVLDPKVVICDEPVSALDVSVQAQILNLLQDMKSRYGITLVFITHDLGVVKNVSDRIMVMYLGRVCEVATPDQLFAAPAHHYTRLLMESVPRIETGGRQSRPPVPASELPSPLDPPSGCRFRTRCPAAQDVCATEVPEMAELQPGHFVACHFPALDVPVTL